MLKDELISLVRQKEIDPAEAIEKFEYPARHISEIPIDNLQIDVLDCGFPTLNEFMVFKQNRGELVILGARPSQGKSAFAFQMASYMAKDTNVLIYSLEMDRESIKARLLAAQSSFSLKRIQKGEVSKALLNEANNKLNRLKYFIDDRSGLDIKTIVNSAKTHHKRYPVGLVIVDYIGLVKTRDRNSRNEEVGDVVGELKLLAKDLKCPVLAASQLNRQCELRGKETGDYRPVMADLKDSGSIEQDADIILFLNREEVYNGKRKGEADVIVAKNRNGETGQANFKFLGASTRFIDPMDDWS